MELRAYWAVIRRRLWIIVALVVIATAFAGYQYYKLSKTPGALKTYQSNVTVRIGLQANTNDKNANATDYLSTGETLADEIVTGPTLTSKDFVARVKQQVDQDYAHNGNPQGANQIDEGAIAGALASTHTHSILTITATYQTSEGAKAIATAVGEVFTQQGSSFLDYEIRNGSSVSDASIHPQVEAQLVSGASNPSLVSGPAGNKPLQLVALILVSLLLGIALAFLMEYLDDRVRNKEELEDLLQLPIIGEIPAASATEKGQSKPRQASVS